MMQVIGHEWAVHSLESSAQREQLRNAYLFCGVHGIGKRTLARQFAQRLLCQQPNAPALPTAQRALWYMPHLQVGGAGASPRCAVGRADCQR